MSRAPSRQNVRYQPPLDGVRALAVLAVLLFHAGVRQLPGGFLGVDAFFVLSGFLITSLLLGELRRTGRIALGEFWLRRARRLLPALLAVLVVVALLARTLAGGEELTLVRGDALATLAYVANWRMIYRGTDYFAQNAAPSPLQHTWSLGIEEQFYLCWPVIVIAVIVFAPRLMRRARPYLARPPHTRWMHRAQKRWPRPTPTGPERPTQPRPASRAQQRWARQPSTRLARPNQPRMVSRTQKRWAHPTHARLARPAQPRVARRTQTRWTRPAHTRWARTTLPGPAQEEAEPRQARLTQRFGRGILLALVLAGALASAIAAALLYRDGDVGRAYFGTDTRAQALLIGCALALVLRARGPSAGPRIQWVSGVAAALGLVITGFLWAYGDGTQAWLYRGGLTLGAIGVAAVLWHVSVVPAGTLSRVLSVAPLVMIGQISYGLYLWHWPLFQLLDADRTGLTGTRLIMLRLAVVLVVATASYWLIERPVRRGVRRPAWFVGRRAAMASALAVTVLVAGTVAAVVSGTRPATVTAAAPVVVFPSGAPSAGASATHGPMTRAGRKPGGQPRITILGDSVAWTVGTYLPEHPGLTVTTRAIQGCGIALLPDILTQGSPHTNYPNCEHWPDRWRSAIRIDDPDVAVILLNRWELMDRRIQGGYQHVGQPAFDAYLSGQLTQGIGIAKSRGAQIVLLTASYTRRSERPDGGLYPEDEPIRVDAWNHLLQATALRFPGQVSVLDLNAVTCPGGRFAWDVDGLRIRSDGLHFTPPGVQQVIAPWLLPQVARIAVTGPPAPQGRATARPD
ncbi:peptidoglycan/LPS O-acetylase OafA/YrhL [Hamadaea flava]|uniref:Acyltransferase family protein n=1 Tax=Hamadaea flava TaxID=1742688 RepID=A0ABV8LQ30_9ACTN|nr:acyltransferase family protein [Hamadaea flava]MCP2322282.1 peptidoglycan/LPS O-acetylase OafA/YrhL [Hamadaea flava]